MWSDRCPMDKLIFTNNNAIIMYFIQPHVHVSFRISFGDRTLTETCCKCIKLGLALKRQRDQTLL
jgi:hypothetical protein